MDDKVVNDLETASPSIIMKVAHDFAAALAETPQFKTFEDAADRFRQDQSALKGFKAINHYAQIHCKTIRDQVR